LANKTSLLPWWGKVLVGFMLLVLLLLLVELALGVIKTNSWNRYAAELRAEGIPLSYDEIAAARRRVPDDENGARVLLDVFKDVPDTNQPHKKRYDLVRGLTPEELEENRKLVTENKALLDSLKRMRGYPRGRFDIDETVNPLKIRLPEITRARHASELAYQAAVFAIVNGDTQSALQWIEIVANIGGTLHEHPTMIGALYQVSTDDAVVDLTVGLLRNSKLSDDQLPCLADLVDQRRASQSIKFAFLGPMAFINRTCDALESGLITRHDIEHLGGSPPSGGVSWMPTFLIRSNQQWAIESLAELVRADGDAKALMDAADRYENTVGPSRIENFVVYVLLPSYTRMVLLYYRTLARLDAIRVGLAAERFRLAHDRYPDSLADLVPTYIDAIPTDPFIDKPLLMVRSETGIVIYSVGENEKDDDGDIGHTTRWNERGDFGVRLLVLEARGMGSGTNSDVD